MVLPDAVIYILRRNLAGKWFHIEYQLARLPFFFSFFFLENKDQHHPSFHTTLREKNQDDM